MMKSHFLTAVLILIALASSGAGTAFSQFTITIPSIPKIKKPKVTVQTTETTEPDNQPTVEKSGPVKTTPAASDRCTETSWWPQTHIESIRKDISQVNEYDPNTKIALVMQNHNEDFVLMSFSKAARDEWLNGAKAQDIRNCPGNSIDSALDDLAAALSKKLPSYLPGTTNFAYHNIAEEKMIRAESGEAAKLQIYKIGLVEPSWLIDKNEWGLPTARYKHGKIWLRKSTDEFPYCRLYSINIIQDYSGGGTYGASYARFVGSEMVGCPAGK